MCLQLEEQIAQIPAAWPHHHTAMLLTAEPRFVSGQDLTAGEMLLQTTQKLASTLGSTISTIFTKQVCSVPYPLHQQVRKRQQDS